MFSDAPKDLPAFSFLFDELGSPAPAALARHLGVTVRTVQRWIAADSAPRAVLLAMFWDTRYGRSAVECRAVNDAMQQAALARCHRDEARERLRELEHVLAVGNFGSANAPLVNHAGPVQIAPPAALDSRDHRPRPAPLQRQAPETARQRVKRASVGG